MSARTTYFGTVYPAECDHMGHLNVAHYVAKFDAASWNFFFDLGVTREAMDAGNYAVAAVEQKLAYKRELMPGDAMEVRSRVLEVKEKAIRFVHEMIHRQSGQVAATSEYVSVCLDRGLRKSRPYPEAVLEAARGLIANQK
ncbi:MAG: acyl-CoA thioesterase [Xanthobacteraceae bacterium]|nr:acyl-CoA thioesterase [Xanthobacteraceae bacterium]MBX3547974.1 acyl-CoA thioesterase [Xanthobacteraceae bacterium]MCW5676054.1 acyl-CoA thioesterase [Xanthobacteraceae bacterium]MCW5677505.1 acyl-CoA thioesterase [Xanthobacteraceae bacterium]